LIRTLEKLSYVKRRTFAMAERGKAAMLRLMTGIRRKLMSATQRPAESDVDGDPPPDHEIPPIPDEDGPHDVPDDQVIEKTLPSVPIADQDRDS
jgi:hypothetical protein